MFSSVKRPIGAALLGFALFGLTACGDGDAGSSASTVPIQPSSYVVRDAVTTTTAPTVAEPDAEGRSPVEQAYVVQSDEYPYNIAIKFDVDLEELRNFNGWEEDTFAGFPGPGGTVRIPPMAKFIDQTATASTDGEESDDEEDDDGSTATPGGCTVGTHEIAEGDYPVKVAQKYDVTLEALLAANNWSIDGSGNVAAWPGVGGEVTIPAGPDCSPTTTTTTTA